jgi:thiamine kinase-like enzyme
MLRGVETEWRPTTLVHNDIKFNNFLVDYDYEHKKIKGIKLIDWELADIGDPLWDAAAVIQNYLVLWLSTDVPEQLAQQAQVKKVKLEEVQPSISSFWKRYSQQLKMEPGIQRSVLVKTTKYVALKLIHSCFEMAPGSNVLQPVSVKMLQMSLNILRSPEDAAVRLLGIK